jgi:hypothetical protein
MSERASLSMQRALSAEVANADFGDVRLAKRLGKIVDALMARPSDSLPKALRTESGLEGAYRFFDNERVTPERVLAPHIEATIERCRAAGRVLAVHDTTQFDFGDNITRSGLGPLRGRTRGNGFFGHFTMAVSAEGQREPLGTLAISHFVRKPGGKGKRSDAAIRDDQDNERRRWRKQVALVEQRLPGAIHVMDREADSYALFCAMNEQKFVVRAQHDRVVELPDGLRLGERERLASVVANAHVVLERMVYVSPHTAKTPAQNRIHPTRGERIAKLLVRATRVAVRRSRYQSSELPPSLDINVVQVIEVDAPPGEVAIEWVLLTNLPIDSVDAVAFIVDSYRARWLIEEFFKALKTGCRVEERQFETLPRLLNVLATLTPVAWQLLLLRHLARFCPDVPADKVLSASKLGALRAFADRPLPSAPSVRDAMLCIAQLGGHLKRNGEPGWLVLARGFHDLLLFERGWAAGAKTSRGM